MTDREVVYWFERSPARRLPPLVGRSSADVVVVGGGIAGLSAAERLVAAGVKVALVEADTCGAGATGRSSGFVTPDSELQLSDLARRFGDDLARGLYADARSACEHIRSTIERRAIDCDRVDTDSVYAGGETAIGTLRDEHETRVRLGFPSRLLDAVALGETVSTDRYAGAVRYGETFAIDAAAYARGLRDALVAEELSVYESSPVRSIAPGVVSTLDGELRAPRVVVCLDRYAPELGVAERSVYRARAWLTLTEPIGRETLRGLFPDGPVMLWDTDLAYRYFRPTADGRILVGGGSLAKVYAPCPGDSEPVHASLERHLEGVFPSLRGVRHTHRWHGLIGVTKDVLPLAGNAPDAGGVFYAMAGAGLPWSVLAGQIAAERCLETTPIRSEVFAPSRAFTTLDPLQPLLGKPLTWALSYPLARRFERGGSGRVRARQRALVAALCVAAAGLLAVAWRRLSRSGCTRRALRW